MCAGNNNNDNIIPREREGEIDEMIFCIWEPKHRYLLIHPWWVDEGATGCDGAKAAVPA